MKKTSIKEIQELRREIHTPSAIKIREASEGESSNRTIEGYAILFDTPSVALYDDGEEEVREIIDKGAVNQELLDSSDILFTMYHNRQKVLGRSKQGKGTLSYKIDDKGVFFSLPLPETTDGDDALALIRDGIVDGCSFAFSTRYYDRAFVERTTEKKDGKYVVTCRVKVITGIYDMTVTPNPAYDKTSVEAREFAKGLLHEEPEKKDLRDYYREMRSAAKLEI